MNLKIVTAASIYCAFVTGVFAADLLPAAVQAKVDAKVAAYASWSTDATIVAAVKANNTTPPAEIKAMTNDTWKTLTLLSPEVKALAKNELATYIKGKKEECVTELFVNAADGSKVAYLSKTTSWIHKGKPKHDLPMTGKNWVGSVEIDESTGVQSVQIAIPVLDGKMPIGSIVFGLAVTKL